MSDSGDFKVAVYEQDLEWEDYAEDIESFVTQFNPLERQNLTILRDHRTQAVFIECHILASKLVDYGTTDVPLDADGSADYRANRDVVADHAAFEQMQNDALEGRRFSNIVAEFSAGESKPLKVIGGQHRFEAVKDAINAGVDIEHGVKVYFQLDNEQRLDVQIISNTNISVSKELLDRAQRQDPSTIICGRLRRLASAGLVPAAPRDGDLSRDRSQARRGGRHPSFR